MSFHMELRNRLRCVFILGLLACSSFCLAQGKAISIVTFPSSSPRVEFGAAKLSKALAEAGFTVKMLKQQQVPNAGRWIYLGVDSEAILGKESFNIYSTKERNIFIAGADASGTLYGCLELADRIRSTGNLPDNISFSDHPQMVLRGACI